MYRRGGAIPIGQMTLRVSAIVGCNLQVVIIADMANGACRDVVPQGQGKSRGAVVEGCDCPAGRALVAVVAVGRCELRAGRGMHGIIGLLPGGQVALRIPAVLQLRRQIVIVVDMAGFAGHIGMSVGQRKSCRAVIELGAKPVVERSVAGLASRGKLCSHMVGIGRFLKIGQVAGRTCC